MITLVAVISLHSSLFVRYSNYFFIFALVLKINNYALRTAEIRKQSIVEIFKLGMSSNSLEENLNSILSKVN